MKKRLFFRLAFLSLGLSCIGYTQENIDIRIWLFQGKLIEGSVPSDQMEILSSFANPKFGSLKSLIGRPDDEFKDELLENIIDSEKVQAIDYLWLYKSGWSKSRPSIGGAIIKNNLAFRADIYRRFLAPPQLAIQTVILRSKEGAIREISPKKKAAQAQEAFFATLDENKMDKIIDVNLLLIIGEPTVLSIPGRDSTYYIAILATPEDPKMRISSETKVDRDFKAESVRAPTRVHHEAPLYPAALRQKNVGGDVGLRITIEKDGKVAGVDVKKTLHPYLDYAAVQAARQWTFEPVLVDNRTVRAVFDYSIEFDPLKYREEPILKDEVYTKEMKTFLDGCADYAQKLYDMSFYFTSEESIKETHYHLKPEISSWEIGIRKISYTDRASPDGSFKVQFGVAVRIMDPERTIINKYTCDYQIAKKGNDLEERRVLLKENGKKISGWAKILDEKRFSVVNPFINAASLFQEKNRHSYSFRIIGEENIQRKKTDIIEIVPKTNGGDVIVSAKYWVAKDSFQIVRSEIHGVPIEGFDDVLKDSVLLNVTPEFIVTHDYKIEKNGVLYPEQTLVNVFYPNPNRKIVKYKSVLSYNNFKFFSVESKERIIR